MCPKRCVYFNNKWVCNIKSALSCSYKNEVDADIFLKRSFKFREMAFTSYVGSLLHLQEIFPSVSSVVIFFTYMVVCLQQAILVTASRTEDRTYPYNPAAVVLLTEILKFIVAVAFYINRFDIHYIFCYLCDNVNFFLSSFLKIVFF